AGSVGEAAHGLDHRAEARTITVWTILAPARHAREDEARVIRGEDVPAEAPTLEGAGQEIFDQHVGVAHEASQQRLTTRWAEVERDGPLAARVDLPPQLAALAQPRAQRVPAARIFDFDDIGAVIGQHGGQHTAGDQPRAVDHAQSR